MLEYLLVAWSLMKQVLCKLCVGYRCIDALVTMGVLVPGGDRTAVRRTAEFFLKNFEVGVTSPCVCLLAHTDACATGISRYTVLHLIIVV